MNRMCRFLMISLAVMLSMAAFSTIAYASESDEGVGPTTTSNIFTPDGTGTVVDMATDEDGKEFYTIITPDEHVFYLVIDRQRATENVYFLDVVTKQDLLSLTEGAEDEEIVVPKSTPEPVALPEQGVQTQPEKQSNVGGIVILVLIVMVIAGAVLYVIKIRKPKDSAKRKPAFDEYDYDEDEYEPDHVEDEELEADADMEEDDI